jgi:hypothetical protein
MHASKVWKVEADEFRGWAVSKTRLRANSVGKFSNDLMQAGFVSSLPLNTALSKSNIMGYDVAVCSPMRSTNVAVPRHAARDTIFALAIRRLKTGRERFRGRRRFR